LIRAAAPRRRAAGPGARRIVSRPIILCRDARESGMMAGGIGVLRANHGAGGPGMIKSIGAFASVLVVALAGSSLAAQAQGFPPPPGDQPKSQQCVRLESQLASLDRGISDPTGGDQIRRYEDAVNKQQFELDRTVGQSRRLGCESSGFFLFGRGQSPQCVELSNQIQRIRANLDRAIGELQRLQGGSADRGEQRRAILGALAVNDCGPQYRAAAPPRQRGFFETLFGAPAAPPSDYGTYGSPDNSQSSTYRTVCVRTCDGFFYPISFATVPAKFQDDERTCQQMCPATEVGLYTYRNPGEEVSQAVSLSGTPYKQLANAFKYRQEFNPSCSCKRPGQSWTEALGPNDPTLERGDVIVTDEKAKALSQPKADPGKPGKQDARKNKASPSPVASTAAPAPAKPPETDAAPPDNDGKRKVRSVGPQFYPVR
jgi:hypothetical protein